MRARKHIRSTSMMTIELFDVTSVFAGICGTQILSAPGYVIRATKATVAALLTPNLSVRGE